VESSWFAWVRVGFNDIQVTQFLCVKVGFFLLAGAVKTNLQDKERESEERVDAE